MRKRILSLLLCVVMLFSLCPQSALAEGTDGEMAIQLGTKAIKDPVATQNGNGKYYTPASYVYFGNNSSSSTPIKWRVLDADKNNAGSDGMFLLSEYLLASGIQFESAWDSNDGDGQAKPNEWQYSDAQKWCSDNLSTYFSTQEQNVMLAVDKTDSEEQSLYYIRWSGSSLSKYKDKLFFLSVRELADYMGNYNCAPGLKATFADGSEGGWWLRSPSADYYNYSGVVGYDGVVLISNVLDVWAARPAFNINLNSVLFTSAAVGGKISAAFGGGSGGEAAGSISKISTTTTNEWKFTLKDDTRNSFNAKLSGSSTVTPGESISIEYSGATTGNNEYVSAILTDASGNALYYGRLVNTTSDPAAAIDTSKGTVSMAIPADLAAGSYTLKVFSEQYNGDKQTDYASDFIDIDLTVLYVITYTVTFDPNGGSGTMVPQTFTEGVAQNLTPNTFTREGFTFIGWNTMADGSGTSFADGASVTASSNATLYAQWKAVPAVTPLAITKQPTDQFVVEGQRAEFSVEATGDGLTYQWYINRNNGRGWRALDGAVGTAYVTSVTDLECDGFQYGCLITDQYGNTLKSDVAVLHVSKVPVLPETGDSSTPMLWLAMSILSMAGILLLRKKAYCR